MLGKVCVHVRERESTTERVNVHRPRHLCQLFTEELCLFITICQFTRCVYILYVDWSCGSYYFYSFHQSQFFLLLFSSMEIFRFVANFQKDVLDIDFISVLIFHDL